jgi:UDP-glucose 4-epimerase
MKIIITGGAGFIASQIADAYIKEGHRVVIIDNLSKGSHKNINSKAKFYKADITDLALMQSIFKKERPEVVNHHAAIAEVTVSVRDPIPTLTTNVLGTANVLLSFGQYGRGRKKFIFASTGGAMYGDPKKVPVRTTSNEDPLSPYGLSKQMGEDAIRFYARYFGFEYFIFRYGNVFGPRQNPKGEAGIVAIFGTLMKSGTRPTIFGDGKKSRDYVYVGDVVNANVAALRKGKNTIVNIGTGKLTTDQKVFDVIAKEVGFQEKPIYAPYRKGEVYRISLDPSGAFRALKWKPKTTFEKGVQTTIRSIS